MKVALVFPPSTFLSDPLVWPPLGLWYIAAQLEKQGHQTEFFDMSFSRELPKDGEYDQVWISSTSPQMYEVRNLSGRWKKSKTVFGGAAAWASPDKCMDLKFDLIVSGESDHPDTVSDLVEEAQNPKEKLYITELTQGRELDWVLPPVRRWNWMYHAYMEDQQGKSHRMASIFTTRGCPLRCSFCESGLDGVIWDRFVRYEPPELVEKQILSILELDVNPKFSGLAYYDDIFILNKKRTRALLELHRKYGLVFRCFLRSDILAKNGGKEYLREMRDGGLVQVFVGVESADNRIKKNIHKGTTIEQDEQVLEWCKELGIICKMSFILGLPGETRESMEKTRQWILKHRPDKPQVNILIPFQGTPLTKHAEEYDVHWDVDIPDEYFFRGSEKYSLESLVSTSHLTKKQITDFWVDLEEELRMEGLHADSSYS